MSALDRLLAKAGSASESAAAQPAAQPAAQETQQPVAQEAAAPATQEAPSRGLPALVNDEQSALATFDFLGADTEGGELSEIAARQAAGGGVSHTLPFISLRNGSWDPKPKYIDGSVVQWAPTGQRDFCAVYVSHRLAATGWIGAGSAGSGEPPAFSYALPTGRAPEVGKRALKAAADTLSIGRKIQFTPSDDRVKFDDIGRITPELQILVWNPEVGFLILVAPGYKSTIDTLESLRESEVEKAPGAPVVVSVEETEEKNKRVAKENPNAKNASWTTQYLGFRVDAGQNGVRLMEAWKELRARDAVNTANTALSFITAQDFQGHTLDQVEDLIARYRADGLL